MAGLSTHILDTSAGKPAANVRIELYELRTAEKNQADKSQADKANAGTAPLVTRTTNSDGRTDEPLIAAGQLKPGTYELHFHAGDYFRASQDDPSADNSVLFLDVVVIRFGISATNEHYHVPLLLSPFGYSTYRGS